LATLDTVLHGDVPLWCVEGEKKALAVAQLGLPAVASPGSTHGTVAAPAT